MEKLYQLIFPQKCFICQQEYALVCKKCEAELPYSEYFYCLVCGKPSLSGETHRLCLKEKTPNGVFSAFKYEGPIRLGIKKSKYHSSHFSVLKKLTELACLYAQLCGVEYEEVGVVPIPLSKKKMRSRGFNQAQKISEVLCKEFSIEHRPNYLRRVVDTKVQYEFGRKERFDNLQGAFSCEYDLSGKNLLLVDDICTSGATFLEAGRVLYNAGAKEVSCFSLAKKF